MSSNPGRAAAVPDGGEVDDHGDVLVTAPGVPPHVLIDPDDLDTVQAGRVLDEQTPALSQDRVVGGVPRHAQSFGNSGHRQVADDDPDQTPPQAGAGDLGPRRRRSGGVLTPHVRALLAAVAAHGEHQRGRAPPERLVRQLPAHRVTGHALAAAPPAPVVRLHDPTRQHGPVRLEQLAGDLQTEAVEAGEGSQVRAREGSFRHVEVFRMGGVGTPIIGRPRRLSGQRRATACYTLDSEEPSKFTGNFTCSC